jgi:hypothetical protein
MVSQGKLGIFVLIGGGRRPLSGPTMEIIIRGPTKPAAKDAKTSMPALDLRKFGSLNLIVIRFRGYLLPYDFLTEVKETLKEQLIRPNAFILLRKDQDGNVSGLEGAILRMSRRPLQ